MKKVPSLGLAAVALFFTLLACGSDEQSVSATQAPAAQAAQIAPAVPAAPEVPALPLYNPGEHTPEELFTVELINDGTEVMITGLTGSRRGFSISRAGFSMPPYIQGLPVTTIQHGAFRYIRFTSLVVLPDGLTHIRSGAFQNSHLPSIVIPDSVVHIGGHAFNGNRLTSLVIPPGVTYIGRSAFSGNHLASLVIPYGVTHIGGSAFSRNHLTNIDIPDSVTYIGDGAFSRNRLTNIDIPDSVTYIGWGAFERNHLVQFTLPYGITIIPDNIFADNHLSSVTIPDSVFSIRRAAFRSNRISEANIPESVFLIGEQAFADNLLTEIILQRAIPLGSRVFDSDVTVIRPEPAAETETAPAVPAAVSVSVNGRLFSAPAWNVAGTSYFHLRDIAYMLNATRSQFDITSDEPPRFWRIQAPYWLQRRPYAFTGTEMSRPDRETREAQRTPQSRQRVFDGIDLGTLFPRRAIFWDFTLDTAQIDGQSYFSLGSFAQMLDFDLSTDAAAGTMLIDTRERVLSEYGLNAAREFLLQYRTLHDPDAVPQQVPNEEGSWPRVRLVDRVTGLEFEPSLYRDSYTYIRSYSLFDFNRTGIPDILIHREVVISGNGGSYSMLYTYRNGTFQRILFVTDSLLDDGHGTIYFTRWFGDGIDLLRLGFYNDLTYSVAVARSMTPDHLVLHGGGKTYYMRRQEFLTLHREGMLGNLLDSFPEFALYMERRKSLNAARDLGIRVFQPAGE